MDIPVRSNAYLLMHFKGGPRAPVLQDVRIFSEETPTRMGDDFYAELVRGEGATFAEAQRHVLRNAANSTAMAWLRNFLADSERVIFDAETDLFWRRVAMLRAQDPTHGPAFR